MCAICGIVYRKSNDKIPAQWIKNMMKAQSHRGPDDDHFLELEGGVLGFNRLSIQDVSQNGRQPMRLPESQASIVFNGEVYNFVELSKELQGKGFRFSSKSDTEVLLRNYLLKKSDSLDNLIGMFAFAIYNPDEGELFAVRDRFGIKPFYYYFNDSFFCFASEIKALLTLPFVPKRPNLSYLYSSVFERSSNTSEMTAFEGILQLQPAHCITFKRDSWHLAIRRYWSLPQSNFETVETSNLSSSADELTELLTSCVKLRLRSDRPVGLMLSGGMDSSSLAALIGRTTTNSNGGGSLGNFAGFFTMGLEGNALDESNFAQDVARNLDIKLQKLEVGNLDLQELIPLTTWHNDEPLPSLNRCVHWHMMRIIAAQDVIVLLNGQGGDELMGGYFDLLVGSMLLSSLNREGHRGFIRDWKSTKTLCGYTPQWLLGQMAKVIFGHRFTRLYRSVTNEMAYSLASPSFFYSRVGREKHHFRKNGNTDLVNTQLLRWLQRDKVPALCHYEDRNSAAHGLEERFPFLDHRLAEFMFKLPGFFKARHGISKYLLRKAMTGILPDSIVNRHSKLGLAVPEDLWIRGKLATFVQDIAASKSMKEREIWSVPSVRKLIERHIAGEVNCGNLIWRIIGTEVWFQMFIDDEHRFALNRAH